MKRLSCHGCGAPVSLTKAAFHVCAYCGNTYRLEAEEGVVPRYTDIPSASYVTYSAPVEHSCEVYTGRGYMPASCRY